MITTFFSQMLETNISKLKKQQDDNYIFTAKCWKQTFPNWKNNKMITTFLQPNVGNKHFQIEEQQDDNYIFTAKRWKQTFPNWKNTRG